jgi:hypothetical protein
MPTSGSWGVEGQLYTGNSTWYGQVGFLDSADDEAGDHDFFHNALFVRGQARWLFGEGARATAEVAYAAGHVGSSHDPATFSAGASGSTKLLARRPSRSSPSTPARRTITR